MTQTAPSSKRYDWPQKNGRSKAVGAVRSTVSKSILADLRRQEPKEIGKLVEEIEKDYQFLLGFLVIKSLVESANVTIEVEGGESAHRLADNLQAKFDKALPHIMKAFGHGRAAFEKTYEISGTGMAFLNDLDYLPFAKTKMIINDYGRFDGISIQGKRTITLEPERSWWFALDSTPIEPHGRSRYLGAPFEIYKQRKKLTENEEIWLSRFALGHGVGYAPAEYPEGTIGGKGDVGQISQSGKLRNPMDDLTEAVETVRSGGSVILCSVRDPKTGQKLFEYQPTVSQPSAAPLETRREKLDVAALRSLGVPERAITQDASTGSYSMAQVHMQILYSTVEGILTQIVASFQQYVIDKCIALNWSKTSRPSLTMVYQPLRESGRNQKIAEIVQGIIQGPSVPPLIAAGIIDFAKLLEIAELPLGDNVEQKLIKIGDQTSGARPRVEGGQPLKSQGRRKPASALGENTDKGGEGNA